MRERSTWGRSGKWLVSERRRALYIYFSCIYAAQSKTPYRPFGKELVLAIKLVLDYADETEEILYADENFQVKEHPVK